MLVGASIAGTTGAVWGACLAALRNESIKFYSASMAANFFLLSSTYIALEEVIADKTGKKDLKTGAGAGALTGGFYAGIIAGRVRGMQGAAAGAVVGAASVFGREQFQRWRLSKALERYEEKHGAGTAPAMYYPNTDILVETKGPVRDLEFPSLLPKSLKTTEEEIERRIQARVEELRQQELDAKNASSPDTIADATFQ